MKQMIKNIVFDIGNVLTYYTWEKHIRSFGFGEEMYERVVNATVKSQAWNEFDRGVMSDEEVIELLIANDPAMEQPIRRMMQDVSGLVSRADYAIPWIRELQAGGYHVYYLSNFSFKAGRECRHALDFIPVTDGGILSCEEKLIKPQPEIYLRLLEKYSLKAEECVFLDDLETNVEAARAQGFYGIVFTTKEDAVSQLAALGVHS